MSSLPHTTLYQPTHGEICHVVDSAKHRWPALANRIDKAAAILCGDLQLDQLAWDMRNVVRWKVSSQSHSGFYTVCGLHCPCQDSRAEVIGNIRFCKHAIAVASYLKILRNHINADIRARKIDLGILHTGEFHAYAGCMGYVQMAKLGRANETYTFVDMASVVRYSLWLAAQQPVAVEWPIATAALAA